MTRKRLIPLLALFVCIIASKPGIAQKTPAEYEQLAINEIKAKRYNEADKALTDCLQVDPKNTPCLYRRALVRSLYIGYGLALEDYNTLVKLLPDNAQVLTRRGSTLYSLKRPAEALADFNKAIQVRSDFAEAYYQRANYYRDQNDPDRAIADYSNAVKYDPKHAISYSFRANLYYKKGSVDAAVADYTKAIELKPDDAYSLYNRGKIYFEQNKSDLAESDFKQAIALNPTYETQVKSLKTLAESRKLTADLDRRMASTDFTLGKLSAAQGKHQEAIERFTESLKRSPDDKTVLLARGMSYLSLNKLQEAEADLKRAAALDQKYADPHTGLARVYCTQGLKMSALAEERTATGLGAVVDKPCMATKTSAQ